MAPAVARPRRSRASSSLVWLGAAAIALVSVGYRWDLRPPYDERTHLQEVAQLLSAGSVLVTAYVLARRQPGNRMWVLTLWFGLAGFLQDFQGPNRLLLTIGDLAYELPALFLVWLSLAFPTGYVRSRIDRVILGWVVAITALAACHAFVDVAYGGHPFEPYLAVHGLSFGRPELEQWTLYMSLPGGVIFLVRLISKAIAARRGARRVSVPLLIAATGATIWFLAQVPFAGTFGFSRALLDGFFWISLLIQCSIPIAFASGALAQQWNRSIVAEMMLELDQAPPGSVEPALARALGDPGLRVLLRRPDGSGYVRPGGAAAPWSPAMVAWPRSWTRIGTAENEVGVVVYDAELDAQPALVRSIITAARFALENERLHADLQAQMRELRASRTRVVDAADAERRRIERNLHDGVQQRLYTVGMELDALRHVLTDRADPVAVRERLEEVDAALRTAIEDLRDVAHGIDPPVLTNRGLEAALRSRTRRSSVPVVLVTELAERLSAPVETAAYYVASEAYANAERHADATRIAIDLRVEDHELVVTVTDDGVGGADATHGSGLRGLVDRVHALDGTLSVASPPGAGTTVIARFPLVPVVSS